MENVPAHRSESQAPAVAGFADDAISSRDILIPRLFLQQPTSGAVGDEEAKVGDIVHSETNEVVAGLDKPLRFLPIGLYKTWRVMNTDVKPPEWVREEPMTPQNEGREWDGVEELADAKGKMVKTNVRYDYTLNFYLLLERDLKNQEPFPVLVSFRRTSVPAGKALATHLWKRAALEKLPWSAWVDLTVSKQKKDTNTYAVYEVKPVRDKEGKFLPVSTEFQAEAAKWAIKAFKLRVAQDRREDSEDKPASRGHIVDEAQGESGVY